ncbi:TPA: hypothetical protein ACH3X1_011630 [Trebouxia sp. C0004]
MSVKMPSKGKCSFKSVMEPDMAPNISSLGAASLFRHQLYLQYILQVHQRSSALACHLYSDPGYSHSMDVGFFLFSKHGVLILCMSPQTICAHAIVKKVMML